MSDTFNRSNATAEQIRQSVLRGGTQDVNNASAPPVTWTPGLIFPNTGPFSYGLVFFNQPTYATVQLTVSYPVAIDQSSGPVSLTAPAGIGADAEALSGGMTFNQNGGYGYVYTGNAVSPFTGGAPSGDTIFLSGPGSSVAAGEGNDTVVAQSGNNQIATGAGNNLVFLQSGNNLVGSEGNDTIVGGSGDDTVSVSGNVQAFGGSGVMTFLNGAGSSLVVGGSGSLGVSGGLGSVTVFGGAAGDNQLTAGQQSSVLVGTASGDQAFARGASADLLVASGGNETLSGFGTTGNNVYFGGSGNDLVIMGGGAEEYVGGTGNDVVIAGQGNDTMFAGLGPDVFTFNNQPGGQNDLIAGFKVGADLVNLQGFAPGANAQVFQTAAVAGGNTVLHLPDGTVVTLLGVTNLTSSSIA